MTKLDLEGVPETMLWPLWNRAVEAERHDRLIEDPWSIQLVDEISYDFAGSFGRPSRGHGVRSRVGDDLVRDFLQRLGDRAVVVALGEGLETQYWRLGEPEVPWLSVDLPEAIAVRERLLPKGSTSIHHGISALDERWIDEIPPDSVPFISAMGLFMYFEEAEVEALLTAIAARLPSAEIFFDAIPPFLSKKTLRGMQLTKNYRAPPMPWGISLDDIPAFLQSIPSLEPVTVQTYADPHPHAMRPYSLLSKIGPVRRRLAPSLVHARVTTR
ncbi:MAG: class I SAM-dependent methyltransferase [Myxococcota bacterium]